MTTTHITSSANPLLKELRRLVQSNTDYRKQGRVWLEGDHLCAAALARGVVPEWAVYSESFSELPQSPYAQAAIKTIVLADVLFASLSSLESPAGMGFVVALPSATSPQPHRASVVLDRVQDAGNVGSILRSAAAFGFTQVLALKGTAALWAPKVLRAGMGAHFGLHLVEGLTIADLDALAVPLVVTSSHQGQALEALCRSKPGLPWPCAWAMGHEGQGVSDELLERAKLAVRIAQPGGEESLNVAAAAAICLHASLMSRAEGV
jgi:RNA methyltransferase, TrmH family